ncbi:MAG: HD domain-containing protein [Dehalococcoidia bacterium]|nr:HD domain-containing protein [Dehalococcoidia bacterium]
MPVKALKISSELSTVINKAAAFLSSRGVSGYLVGGTVRDGLLGIRTHDIDLAVEGPALTLAREFADANGGAFVALNDEHQVARVILHADGREWRIDFAAMQGNLLEDLSRRDFTINAMAISLVEPLSEISQVQVIDPLNGIADLTSKKIRSCSDTVFQSDPVRMLRAVRLSVKLGFMLDPSTSKQIKVDAHLIIRSPGERVRDELARILEIPKAASSIRALDKLGLLLPIIPELKDAKDVQQPPEHYWDVFEHSVETVFFTEVVLRIPGITTSANVIREIVWNPEVEAYFQTPVGAEISRIGLIKLAALFHDIAKPETKMVDEKGKMHFYGHPEQGAEKIIAIMRRLRFSGKETEFVEKLVKYHLRPGLINGNLELPTRRAVYRYYRDTKPVSIDLLYMNLADYLAARGPLLEIEEWKRYSAKVRYTFAGIDEPKVVTPERLIDGNSIMQSLNLTPGPIVGELLETVREAQAVGKIKTREDAIALAKREFSKKPAPGADNSGLNIK